MASSNYIRIWNQLFKTLPMCQCTRTHASDRERDTLDTEVSCSSKEKDASKQDFSTPLCLSFHHALYQRPQMSAQDIKIMKLKTGR